MIIIAASMARPGLSQNSKSSQSWKFLSECSDVAKKADLYFSEHGFNSYRQSQETLTLSRGSVMVSSIDGNRQPIPWTDAHGSAINDFRVYWNFADRRTGEKLPFGVWHLRLSHYVPLGEMKLTPSSGGCDVSFLLRFRTDGANMFTILGVDSMWSYESNGRLEREYMEAISATEQRKSASQPPE